MIFNFLNTLMSHEMHFFHITIFCGNKERKKKRNIKSKLTISIFMVFDVLIQRDLISFSYNCISARNLVCESKEVKRKQKTEAKQRKERKKPNTISYFHVPYNALQKKASLSTHSA